MRKNLHYQVIGSSMMIATLAWAIPYSCFIPDNRPCSDMIQVGYPVPRYTGICPDQAYSDPTVVTILGAYAGQPGNRASDADCWVLWYSGVRLYGGCYYPPINDPPDPNIINSSHPTYSTPGGPACVGY